jgi:hypothetical protein
MYAPTPSEMMNDEVKETSEKEIVIRRMHTDETPSQNIPILIMDSAADMSMVGQGFEVLFFTGEKIILWGAMASLNGCEYDVVAAAAVIQSKISMQQYIIIINQAAYIPDKQQYESLLHTDQARYHNIVVKDLGKFFRDGYGNPGKQSIEVNGFEIPLQHDCSKYFLSIRTPMESDWEDLPIVELTSPNPWCNNISQLR